MGLARPKRASGRRAAATKRRESAAHPRRRRRPAVGSPGEAAQGCGAGAAPLRRSAAAARPALGCGALARPPLKPADSADAEEHRHAPLQRWSRQHGDVLLAMARMGCGHGRRRGSPAAGGGGRTAA